MRRWDLVIHVVIRHGICKSVREWVREVEGSDVGWRKGAASQRGYMPVNESLKKRRVVSVAGFGIRDDDVLLV